MHKVKFTYNTETCQYERVKIRWREGIVYALGVILTSALLLTVALLVDVGVSETAQQKTLQAENKKLKDHKIILEKELGEIESILTILKHEEKSLYTKLFDLPPVESIQHLQSISKEQILLADASHFNTLLEQIQTKTSGLLLKAETTHAAHANRMESDMQLTVVAGIPSRPPVANFTAEYLVSGFGKRINPFHKGMYSHPGVDITVSRGTEVLATADGKVTEAKRSQLQAGYGNYVVIDHGNGFITRYAHLEEIFIKAGQKVTKSMVIGTSGNSGGSIAPHVHYEVIRNGVPVDPVYYIIENLTSAEHGLLVARSTKQNQSLD